MSSAPPIDDNKARRIAMNELKTRWFDKVSRECPLADYPRPQLERKNWICLNGSYDYAVTGEMMQSPQAGRERYLCLFQ